MLREIIFDKSYIIKAVFRFLVISVLCFFTVLLFMCITAAVISKMNFSYDMLMPVTAAAIALSAALDGYVLSRYFKENGLIWGMFAAVIIVVFLIIASAKYGTFALSDRLFTKIAVAVTSGAIGGITGVNIN